MEKQSLKPTRADQAAYPTTHPKPGEPGVDQHHLGLTKLQMFTMAAMQGLLSKHGYLINPHKAIDIALEQLNALDQRCETCGMKLHVVGKLGASYYVCTNRPCEMFGRNDTLRKEDLPLYRSMLSEIMNP